MYVYTCVMYIHYCPMYMIYSTHLHTRALRFAHAQTPNRTPIIAVDPQSKNLDFLGLDSSRRLFLGLGFRV